MNFFEHQDQARQNTKKLVGLFALAIITLIAITTVFLAGFLYYFDTQNQRRFNAIDQASGGHASHLMQILTPELVATIAVGIIAVIAIGSLYKWMQLSGGGENVAESLGGRRIQPNTSDAQERKLLNVVEEMAIASGTPVPPVYLLEEQAINAFAAGYSAKDAVIGITRGCMELLDRDQLQGVIAHEFSHILHGDMRLNIRLIGVLHGILVIGLLGSMILRSASYGSAYRHHTRTSSSRNKNAAGNLALGLGLVIIGYAGTFFGNLIKAAVSRQREYLADAAAVQFTRNPEGISQALQKIGGYSHSSQLQHNNAEEFSHMYFGAGVRSALSGWMATHPPLDDRIRRIAPNWNGHYPRVEVAPAGLADSQFGGDTAHQTTSSFNGATPLDAEALVDQIGNPGPKQLNAARHLIDSLPHSLQQAAQDPFAARALIYALLIHDSNDGQAQWQQLKQRAHPVVFKQLQSLHQDVQLLPIEQRLPLFELSVPALKTLSEPQYRLFKDNLIALIKADRQVEVFEWALYRMLVNALEPAQHSPANASIGKLHVACQQLLSTLAWAGHTDYGQAEAAYQLAMKELELANLPLLGDGNLALPMLDGALRQLARLKPLQKPALLKAMVACIQHDQRVETREYELLRAIADCLDCPMPPLH